MHHGDVPFGKVMVPRPVAQEDQRKKQRTRHDRDKRLMGTMGVWMPEGGSNSGGAEMSMEPSKGGSDLCLKVA